MSKSLGSLYMFQDWYAKGNRMPEDKTILYEILSRKPTASAVG